MVDSFAQCASHIIHRLLVICFNILDNDRETPNFDSERSDRETSEEGIVLKILLDKVYIYLHAMQIWIVKMKGM